MTRSNVPPHESVLTAIAVMWRGGVRTRGIKDRLKDHGVTMSRPQIERALDEIMGRVEPRRLDVRDIRDLNRRLRALSGGRYGRA